MNISEDFAYWVGVAQGDGYLKRFVEDKKVRYYIQFGVCEKSLPMLIRFQEISTKLFNKKAKIFYSKKYKQYLYKIGVAQLLDLFDKLEISFEKPTIAPKWCLNNKKLFCAYLAGMIDADGDVRIGRSKYPQCAVRISTNGDCPELKDQISNALGCSVNMNSKYKERVLNGRVIRGTDYRLEFYVSKKNKELIREHLLSHLQLKYKGEIIKLFIEKHGRNGVAW